MHKTIIDFISNNKIATFCCTDRAAMPYCFNCFYAFDEQNHLLFFKSSSQTWHAQLLAENANIAGSILPEKIDILALKGIQLTGKASYNEISNSVNSNNFYHKKFPFALAMPGHVWCIKLDSVKMTDNTNLFGKKLTWTRNNVSENTVAV